MTKVENRVLYLLMKAGEQVQRQTLSMAMSRTPKIERERALATLEDLGMISSAKLPTPPGKRGRGGLVYWLTEAGRQATEDMIERGEIADPRPGGFDDAA